MAATQVHVLIAVRDTALAASAAQAFMQLGAAVSMSPIDQIDDLVERLRYDKPELLVSEIGHPPGRDLDSLEEIRSKCPDLSMVAILSQPSLEVTQIASRHGINIWALPMSGEMLIQRAHHAIGDLDLAHTRRWQETNVRGSANWTSPIVDVADGIRPETSGDVVMEPPAMVGENPRMVEIRETIRKVAGTDVTVLVRGESGVGKEIVARLLFEHSRRRNRPFVKVNCAAIPHDLLESELFGYEAGAFTGAVRAKPGKFELADRGTLFLDEIAEMHPMLQAKLLHVLQDGRFSRLGAKRDVSVDVRVVCATNKLLEERVREGLFREDLLYRINVVSIYIPPLRERRDEIPVITQYLLLKYASQYGRPLRPLSEEVTRRMLEYDWPGNIRELENLCKRFVIVGSETQILRELSSHNGLHVHAVPATAIDSPKPVNAPVETLPAEGLSLLEVGRRAAWQAERQAIREMLETTRWNRREASRRLHISYKALLNKIKQMELETPGGISEENTPRKPAIQ